MTPQTIAKMAAEAIDKQTQGTEPVWIATFTDFAASTDPHLKRRLYGSLRTAAEILGARNKPLGADLNRLLGWLDAIRP